MADLGFVVFVPTWGPAWRRHAFTYERGLAINSQAACAVAFARAHAAEYGGDPATMIVFGHSGGANTGGDGRLRPARAVGGLSRGHDARRDRRPGHLGRQLDPLRSRSRGMTPPSPPTRGSWTS